MRLPRLLHTTALGALILAGCQAADVGRPGDSSRAQVASSAQADVPPPLALDGSAYDVAGEQPLPSQAPEELGGLHNVFHLSANIVSGSEPHGTEAFEALRAMGVRTIVSVDGKEPEAQRAAEFGMRYVHVPVQYKGISEDQLARLAKTFRELEGPFYVHCFHGKHRGPAAAAVGRVVLDGTSREQAISEMRQYCGTSSKYEGLYQAIAAGEIPTFGQTNRYAYDFEAAHHPQGIVGTMVVIARAHDQVQELSQRQWSADAEHPDLDAVNEARTLAGAFEFACGLDEVRNGPAQLAEWFEASRTEAHSLVTELEALRSGDASAEQRAGTAWTAVRNLCNDCHGEYRN